MSVVQGTKAIASTAFSLCHSQDGLIILREGGMRL